MIISNHNLILKQLQLQLQFPMATFSSEEIQNFFTKHATFQDGVGKMTAGDLEEAFLDLEQLVKTRHGVKARRVVDSAERCYARSWSGGKGGQCGSKRVDGSDYCKRCAKKADETCVPCSFTEDGKKTGLHFGDIREEVPFLSPSGAVALVWKDDVVRAKIIAAMEDGATYHKFTGEGKKGKTSLPRIPGQKKAVEKKKSVRGKNAFLFFLGDGNRAKFKEVLIAFYKHTGKHPNATLSFLVENDLDLAAAKSDFDAKVGGDEWNAMIESASWENDADFSKELKGGLITGPTSKLGGLVWNSMSDDEKAPYQKMAKEEKAKKIAALEGVCGKSGEETLVVKNSPKMKTTKLKMKKTTKKSKPLIKRPTALAAEEDAGATTTERILALVEQEFERLCVKEARLKTDVDNMSVALEGLCAQLAQTTTSADHMRSALTRSWDHEVEKIVLADGVTVFKDEDGKCYLEDGDEMGMWDSLLNTVV